MLVDLLRRMLLKKKEPFLHRGRGPMYGVWVSICDRVFIALFGKCQSDT